jgi:hypothetical protein
MKIPGGILSGKINFGNNVVQNFGTVFFYQAFKPQNKIFHAVFSMNFQFHLLINKTNAKNVFGALR